jgi:hypothetical protein
MEKTIALRFVNVNFFEKTIALRFENVKFETNFAQPCPLPIGNADQTLCAHNFFSFSVRHYYWRRVHRYAVSIGGI